MLTVKFFLKSIKAQKFILGWKRKKIHTSLQYNYLFTGGYIQLVLWRLKQYICLDCCMCCLDRILLHFFVFQATLTLSLINAGETGNQNLEQSYHNSTCWKYASHMPCTCLQHAGNMPASCCQHADNIFITRWQLAGNILAACGHMHAKYL